MISEFQNIKLKQAPSKESASKRMEQRSKRNNDRVSNVRRSLLDDIHPYTHVEEEIEEDHPSFEGIILCLHMYFA